MITCQCPKHGWTTFGTVDTKWEPTDKDGVFKVIETFQCLQCAAEQSGTPAKQQATTVCQNVNDKG